MIISIDTEKTLEKVQHPFMIRTFNKLGSRHFLKSIKGISEDPFLTLYLLVRGWALPKRSGQGKDIPSHPVYSTLYSVHRCCDLIYVEYNLC